MTDYFEVTWEEAAIRNRIIEKWKIVPFESPLLPFFYPNELVIPNEVRNLLFNP